MQLLLSVPGAAGAPEVMFAWQQPLTAAVRLRRVQNADRSAAAEDLARAGGRDAPVEVANYDPAWSVAFEAEPLVPPRRRSRPAREGPCTRLVPASVIRASA